MSIYEPEDRFRELGMKVPDLSFLRKPIPPAEQFGREALYNTRALVGNWFEDRRAYKQICPRVTGITITQSDYKANCPESPLVFPPATYQRKLINEGQGTNLLRNSEDYCEYLSNFTTTSDLMYNWDVRRAGVKPKPWRKWRLVEDAKWFPDVDNTSSFGNLTQLGYRKSGQVPMLPNDWDVYANNPTTYEADYSQPRYPDHYVHCRRAPSKEIHRENEEMITIRVPGTEKEHCYKCAKQHKEKPADLSCACVCHAIDAALREPKKRTKVQLPYNAPRFSNFMPASMLKQKPGMQMVYPCYSLQYRTLKHPPHIRNAYTEKCDPNKDCPAWSNKIENSPFNKPDVCTDFAGDLRRE